MSGIDGIKPRNSRIEQFDDFDNKNRQQNFDELDKNEDKFFGDIPQKKKFSKNIKHHRINLDLNFSYKSLFIASLVCFLTIFSLARGMNAKKETDRLARETKNHIAEAFLNIENGNMQGAVLEADEANKDIKKVKLIAQSWGQDIKYLRFASASNSKILANERLLDASYNIINTLVTVRSNLSKISFADNDPNSADSNIQFNLTESQKILIETIDDGKKKLARSRDELSEAKRGLSGEDIKNVDQAMKAVDSALSLIDSYNELLHKDLTWLSGEDGAEKNILILFQNNAELRGGSGGSLGSFGVARFKDGQMTKIDFGTNIYKIDKAFRAKEKIPAPDELKWLIPEGAITMKDSGFDVDGPKAMQNILSFYSKETGQSADGVIMIDTTAIISLLKVIGPINVPEFGKTIDAENFMPEVQHETHAGYFDRPGAEEENEPKKILALMMPKFLSGLFASFKDEKKSAEVFTSLSSSLRQKDLTLYFTNDQFQNRLMKLNYTGAISSAIGDYLYVNNSNIAGQKSSLSVDETVRLNSRITPEGEVVDELDLLRKHNGADVLPDGTNRNFVRLLVPENAEKVNFNMVSGNFEQMMDKGFKNNAPFWLTNDSGKRFINFWMNTKPGEQSEVKISYKTGYKVDLNNDFIYAITFQKQPGALADHIEFELNYPSGFAPENVKNFDHKNSKILIKFDLKEDRTVRIRFKKDLKNS